MDNLSTEFMFVYAPSQWETALHCNVISHWLGAYTKWSLFMILSCKWSCPCILSPLTHWGRVTHICVGKLISIGSDNGLSPGRRQANTWTNAGILLIGPLGTNFSEILIEIQTFSLKKIRLKTASAKRRPFCLGLNMLMNENDKLFSKFPAGHFRQPWTGNLLPPAISCCLR